MYELTLRADGAEIVDYDVPEYPVHARDGDLAMFAGYAAACHWHEDLELLWAQEGDMEYFVNGARVHIPEGGVIFVNARRLHYGYSERMRNCRYRTLVFHPAILGRFAPVARAVERLTDEGAGDYLLLTPGADGGVIACMRECGSGDALDALACCARLTALLCRRADAQERWLAPSGAEWQALRQMIAYVQAHFTGRVRLDDIAAAGAVCRSRCCRIFRERLGKSPIAYVTECRLDRACELLREGSSVTDAAMSSGFDGASYFAETFRKVYGIAPREYRRRWNAMSRDE